MQKDDRDSVQLVHYEKKVFEDDRKVLNREFMLPTILRAAVKYMTIFLLNDSNKLAFTPLLFGAEGRGEDVQKNMESAKRLIEKINGLDDESIINLCKLSVFDDWNENLFRFITEAAPPSESAIQNIRTMIERNVAFWKENGLSKGAYGLLVPDGITETGGTAFFDDDSLEGLVHEREDLDTACWLNLFWYWYLAETYSKPYSDSERTVTVFHPALNTAVRLQMKNTAEE